MEELFRVGVISNTHGIRGEVKVYPTTDNVRRFDDLKEVILDTGKEQLNLHVTSVKYFKNMVILKFKEFDNINDIIPYKGMDLLVTRENAIPVVKIRLALASANLSLPYQVLDVSHRCHDGCRCYLQPRKLFQFYGQKSNKIHKQRNAYLAFQ